MTETFSYPKTLKSSWEIIKKNWKFLLPAILATGVLLIILQVLQRITEDQWVLSLLSSVLSLVLGLGISLGWAQITIRLVRGTSEAWEDFVTNTKTWFHYFVARIIYGFFTICAMFAIMIPVFLIAMTVGASTISIVISIAIGIAGVVLLVWLMIRYMFISFIAIDHPRTRGWNMLKESARLTKGHMMALFGFFLLMGLINIIGLLLFLIGLFITIPLTGIATGFVYEHLKKNHTHDVHRA